MNNTTLIETELNYKEFAEELFKESYEEKKLLASFNIINAYNTEEEVNGLFEVLCLILLEGIKKFHKDDTNKVDLSIIELSTIEYIKKCFKRIDIDLIFSINTKLEKYEKGLRSYSLILNSISQDINDIPKNLYYEIAFNYL